MSNMDLEVCWAFRCSLVELAQLKQACREEMLDTYVNGRPFLDQDPPEVDGDGAIREGIFQAVADSNVFFSSMLSGSRWIGGVPSTYAQRFEAAKARIIEEQDPSNLNPKRARIFSPATSSDPKHDLIYDTIFPDYSLADACVRADGVHEDSTYPDTPVMIDGEPAEHHCCTDAIAPFPDLLLSAKFYQNWAGYHLTEETEDCNHSSLPFTPANPCSASESDGVSAYNADASDDTSDDVMSEARDPFRDSPCHTIPDDEEFAPGHSMQMNLSPQESLVHSPMPRSASPSPLGNRPTLSTRVQRAVHDATVGLEARIAKLEDTINASYAIEMQLRELVTNLLTNVGAIVTTVDAALEHMENAHGNKGPARANSI